VLEQVAVVAGDLDHAVLPSERVSVDHRLRVAPRVLHPGVRVGREVRVLGEDLIGRHVLGQLHQQAALADPHVKRIEGLHRVEALERQKALAERRHPEVEERARQRRAAVSTLGSGNDPITICRCRRHTPF
jgi:hypothetical protein